MSSETPYDGEPILQVLDWKPMAGERSRLVLSDGVYFESYIVLPTHLNHLVTEGQLNKNTIIKVQKHTKSSANDQR